MTTDVPLKCRCGKVRGVARGVSPETGNRAVCYCDDCQAYAFFLERPELLDAWGGTAVFQTAPRNVTFTEGADEVRLVRLSPKGLHRWYAGCCNTPIGNTLTPKVPFVGVSEAFIALDDRARDEALGPVRAYILGRFARPGAPSHVHPRVSLGAFFRLARLILGWKLGRKGLPSPFFVDARTPSVAARVLTDEERAAVYAKVVAAGGVTARAVAAPA